MAGKVDEAANFVFVQLIEQEPGMYASAAQTMLSRAKWILLGKEFLMRRRSLYPG
jgi:hypothetical protein